MKVLILITKSNWGGAQRYVYDLATNLPKTTYSVEVLSGGKGVLIDELKKAGIKASGDLDIERDVNILKDFKIFLKLISILKKDRPDILHVNSSKIGGLGALAGRVVGIKNIIFTAHGWAFNENRALTSKLIIKFLHWFTIVLSHRTISVSENLKSQMENWPLILNKITVIHNGIKNEPIFSKINARNELAKVNGTFRELIAKCNPKNLIIVGSVGELHTIKGYEHAIKGIKSLIDNLKKIHPTKEIVYTIMGEGEYRKDIEKIIKKLDMQESVFILGLVPIAFQYIKAFDIYIMPSISEGLPYSLLEAGLASLPIVATAVGGIPEVIDDMETGILIQPKKPREIQHALEFFITHKKTQKEYSLKINKKVLKGFSIEKMIEDTLKIYNNK